MSSLDLIKSLENDIILKYKSQNNEHWNWAMNSKSDSLMKFKDYIKFNKKISLTAKKYYLIYNWIHRRLFINKCIKLVEYYYRPNQPGYWMAFNNFMKVNNAYNIK